MGYKFQALALATLSIWVIFLFLDFRITWLVRGRLADLYYFNRRDLVFISLFATPAILSHLITIWGHYYRADDLFQESIRLVSTSSVKERKRISPVVVYMPNGIKFLGKYAAFMAYVAFGSGYAAMGSCGLLLLLVLRRSMLQALGFTYADILPLHRWMGVAFIVWSTIHTICYILYYVHFNAFWRNFNFDGTTRGPQNLIALVAYAALLGLGITAIPQVRRSCYLLFITLHRVFTVITFVGTLMHFPYYMIWYYVLPSVCLYLADRFVPKFIQSCAISPEAICSFDKEADILTIVLVSKDRLEPLKPYYPGDYVNIEFPEISMIYHPFTIASYWAEDPYSMTIYVRTFQETKTSWTGALATLCEDATTEEPMVLKARVDGVFGDRTHDYLSNGVMVIFSAGAAITTFMSLLKAMAAQIEASQATMNNAATIEVHLICTFRYESELYAYGDFMHRITHDPRFTSWLHTQIYVSRPDKMAPPPLCESGLCTSEFVCGRVDEPEQEEEEGERKSRGSEAAPLLGGSKENKSKYGSVASKLSNARRVNIEEQGEEDCCMGCGAECSGGGSGSGSTSSSASSLAATISVSPPSNSRSDSASTLTTNDVHTKTLLTGASASAAAAFASGCYRYKTLPTFPAANSAAIATVHAKKDLFLTTMILVLPMLAYLWGRAIPWEGTYKGEYRWCRTTKDEDQHMTNRCMWSYAILPGVVHVLAASCIGYLALFVARRTNLFRAASSHGSRMATASVAETNNAAFRSYANLIRGLAGDGASVAAMSGSATLHRHGVMKAAVKKQQGIEFKRGRIQVNHHIQELISIGVGHRRPGGGGGEGSDDTEALIGGVEEQEVKVKEGGVIVFGGGPDAFVDMIEESCKKARWVVDFHRETWAP
ncbi:ferric/cupric-chelate reductase [Linnemannia hyalina]|uniref:Ferric/cupric-chelate reductase n=1 Tax=Linnemannia hyalina TaxID=64524 RepID=A0A9P7XHU0_9FUNG|nr:ferric/cupric-chelate reductase [Linnemannia hyalina]